MGREDALSRNGGHPRHDVARSRSALVREVLQALPYGVLVVDQSGRTIAWNSTCRELLGLDVRNGDRPTCCSLFGCGLPGTPLAAGCITRAALLAGTRLAEVRVGLELGRPLDAVWLTASRLPHANGVVLHIRPGERTESGPAAAAELAPRLRIRALGPLRLHDANGPLRGDWLAQRPGKVLKLLITERHRIVPVEEMGETLWPDRGMRALSNARQFVRALREHLEPGRPRGASSFIASHSGGYGLDRLAVQIDADLFEDWVRAAFRAGDEDPEQLCSRLDRALALYRGDFLADEPFAEWAGAERGRLRALAGEALRTLSRVRDRMGDLEGACEAMARLAELEPYNTDVHRSLILMYTGRGRRSEALRGEAALSRPPRTTRENGSAP
jgi:DNA-binding SARP family transcriptional activator